MKKNIKVKVKLSRYRPGVAQRVGRGIALLFHDRGTRRWVSVQQHTLDALYPRERPGTHFTGGWVVSHRDSIAGRPAGSSVTIPTELPATLSNKRA